MQNCPVYDLAFPPHQGHAKTPSNAQQSWGSMQVRVLKLSATLW